MWELIIISKNKIVQLGIKYTSDAGFSWLHAAPFNHESTAERATNRRRGHLKASEYCGYARTFTNDVIAERKTLH